MFFTCRKTLVYSLLVAIINPIPTCAPVAGFDAASEMATKLHSISDLLLTAWAGGEVSSSQRKCVSSMKGGVCLGLRF